MKLLKALSLMFVSLLLLASCSCQTTIEEPTQEPAASHMPKLDDTRFLTSGPLVSKGILDVLMLVGVPTEIVKGDCSIQVPMSKKLVMPLTGDTWAYANNSREVRAERLLCVAQGYVVSERMQIMSSVNGRMEVSTTEHVDNALAKSLMMGEKPLDPKDNIGREPGFEI